MASTVRSHRRAHAVRSRRRVTAIGVPSAVVALIGVAFAAAPAIASNNTALPFPTVCASGQSGSSSASASASSSSATPSTTATGTPSPSTTSTASPSASTTAKAQGAQTSPSASGTGTSAATGGSSASPSASSSGSGDGVWGWLNGVWTWIFSDAQYVGQSGAVAAAAPLAHGGAHFEDVADSTDTAGTASTSSAASTSSSDSNCISSASAAALKAKAEAGGTSEGVYAGTTPWVMKTSSMLMYDLTYNGVKTVKVWNAGAYEDEQVLDFTASKLTITSMVTYSIQNGQTVYNNAGSGTTTTLIDPHLMVVSMTAQLLGLIPQTYTPSNQPPLPVGLTVPLIPVLFTDVTTQLAFLNTGTISVPGFDGFGVDGTASPE